MEALACSNDGFYIYCGCLNLNSVYYQIVQINLENFKKEIIYDTYFSSL